MEHILIELARSRGQDQKHVLCTWMELLTCSMLAMWRYRIACFEKLYYDQRNMLANFGDKIILECLFLYLTCAMTISYKDADILKPNLMPSQSI